MKKVIIVFLATIFATLLIIFVSMVWIDTKYSKWETSFEDSMNPSYLVDEGLELENILTDKVSEYTLSNQAVDTIRLSPSEVGYVIFDSLNQYANESFTFKKVYIQPSKSLWTFCTEVSFAKSGITPWLCADVNKDNVQTPQLYITDVRVGPFSVSSWGDMLSRINSGISNSLLTVNENGFSGRYFENIELLEDAMVIKGSQY